VNTGNFTDMETITALQALTDKTKNVVINNESNFNSDIQDFYFNINNISSTQKVFLFVGLNLRLENPLLNIRFRKLSTLKSVLVAFIGTKFDVNINIMHLGNNLSVLKKIIEGKHYFVSLIKTFLKRNNNNISIKNFFKNSVTVIFGEEFNKKISSKNVNILTQNFSSINFSYNILHNSVGKINMLELGFYNNKILNINTPNIYYLIGTDYIRNIKSTDLVIFQGHHNDKIRLYFDIILPTIN
jgi:NADH-quinone oxidoreductase subunit G